MVVEISICTLLNLPTKVIISVTYGWPLLKYLICENVYCLCIRMSFESESFLYYDYYKEILTLSLCNGKKSCTNWRRDMEFEEVWDHIFSKISLIRWVMRFGQKSKSTIKWAYNIVERYCQQLIQILERREHRKSIPLVANTIKRIS